MVVFMSVCDEEQEQKFSLYERTLVLCTQLSVPYEITFCHILNQIFNQNHFLSIKIIFLEASLIKASTSGNVAGIGNKVVFSFSICSIINESVISIMFHCT